MNKTVIRLFKSAVGKYDGYSEKALQYGIIMPKCEDELVDYAIKTYGKDGELFNSAFHKSFDTVKNTDELTLLIQQCLHYLTTYGTNFTSPYVYIPTEELEVPNLDIDKIRFVNITAITEEQLKDKIVSLCNVTLKQETVNDVVALIKNYQFYDIVNSITNKEVKCQLCRVLNVVPSDPNEMLRYMIYLATGSTLKIKNQPTITIIRRFMNYSRYQDEVNEALKLYVSTEGYEKLASIFITNKDLFLAFKNSDNARIMNKLNKLGKKPNIKATHTPKVTDVVTNTDYPINYDLLGRTVEKMPVFKHMALLNALNYASASPEYMEYKIRNGRTFYTEAKPKDISEIIRRRNYLYCGIIKRVFEKVADKTYFIPNGVDYVLPTSEKQFIGDIPNKSKVTLTNNDALIVAIAWETECDLDLSIIDERGFKVGWNGVYKTNSARTLFSGDMTHLEDGRACEAVFVDADSYKGSVYVNLYSNRSGSDVPFKLIIAKADKSAETLEENYLIDPNDVLVTVNLKCSNTERGMTIGTFNVDGDTTTFAFDLDKNGSSMVSRHSEVDDMRLAVNSLKDEIGLTLRDFLVNCGANVVDTEPIEGEYVDLSLENISKETLLEIFLDK